MQYCEWNTCLLGHPYSMLGRGGPVQCLHYVYTREGGESEQMHTYTKSHLIYLPIWKQFWSSRQTQARGRQTYGTNPCQQHYFWGHSVSMGTWVRKTPPFIEIKLLKCIKCMFLYSLSLEYNVSRTCCGICKGRVHDLIIRRVKYEYVHIFIAVGCVCVRGWRWLWPTVYAMRTER